MKNKFNSIVGLALVLGIVILGNLLLNKMSVRLDITEEKLFTLSEGTVNIIESIDDRVSLKFYYSKSLEGVPPQFKNYQKRVKSLLQEYVELNDHINLEIIDPEPDSDEEEVAQRYGITGQPLGPGLNFYFGLVVSNFSGEETLPFFDVRRERFLEYDITRSLYLLNLTGKPKVGVLSSLDVLGVEAPPQMPGMPPQPNQPQGKDPWIFTNELKKFYDLVKIDAEKGEIPADVNLLMVMHAKDLNEKMQYAIDQFVLSGKNAIFFVDPMYMEDQRQQNQFQPPKPNTSLDKIFSKWGIEYSSEKITADPQLAYTDPRQKQPAVIVINENVVSDDVTTAQLSSMIMLYPGKVALKEGTEGVTYSGLISTSDQAKSLEKFKVMYNQNGLMSEFKSGGAKHDLAGIFTGKFKSAFDKAPEGATGTYKAEADAEVSVMVVADMDMLFDQYCMRKIEIMGQVLGYQPINQNTVFLNNAVEKMTGNKDLISLRSRGKFSRPFTKVADMEKDARDKWQKQEEELQSHLKSLEEKINSSLKQAGPNQLVISDEGQKAIEEFKEERRKVKKQLRDVRKNLRGDIENLGTTLKAVNILIGPFIVILFGCFIAVTKSRRVK